MEPDQEPQVRINLITPPDKLYNLHTSILLVYPTDDVKTQLQRILENSQGTINVYLYEEENSAYDWLFSVLKMSNVVVLDIDNFPAHHRDLISFMIAHSNVFWLTKGEHEAYNKISNNRIYDLDWLQNKLIGDNIETEK